MSTASPSESSAGFELARSYSPDASERAVRALWEDRGTFHADPGRPGDPYSIVIPPPNVTAALHLGHALNNTLQDVLVRWHRMRGDTTLWMPGTDHAGIATQAVVEKRLMLKGERRTDYSREEFVALVQEWKDEYETTILEQLRSMGCSCDYERTRFTMDDVCASAVREAFFRLFRDDLIYRGKRLVNWDPVTQTALADDEVEMEEVDGSFWYLRYPLVHASENPDDPFDCQEVTWSELAARGHPVPRDAAHEDDAIAWVTVATTRPETYLGDTAVAVNPEDPRASALRGLFVQLPLVGRVIPIIEDDYVVRPDPESSDPKARYASGFLKVTPAHDPNDWEIGLRHDLPVINVMAPDGTISGRHGWEDIGDAHLFEGRSREDARTMVVEEFKARGLLDAVRPYTHTVGHSYRSHVPVEPYLSDQWYVRVTDDRLRGAALRALDDEQYVTPEDGAGERGTATGDGELRFWPPRYARTFQFWHENLRDWCISRQLWWGHRIPVWSIDGALPPTLTDVIDAAERDERVVRRVDRGDEGERTSICVRDAEGEDATLVQAIEEGGLARDPDVLDTWFSSALWPMSTMGWPDPAAFPETDGLLDRFNPSSVLCTAREIITLWVSRMVMFNRYFRGGTLPFRHVFIHAMIQDGHGQKMSKSLGNGVDPRDIIHRQGADAMRFTLVQMTTQTQDVRLPVDMVCPHTGTVFEPAWTTSAAGYRVAAPIQASPGDPARTMISGYGAATGEATPSEEVPLARNSSSRFDVGRNFCNKLWNATRFALANLTAEADASGGVGARPVRLVDRWMITRLHRTLHTVEDALTSYQFNQYADAMYDVVWRDFCDWYLEAIKPTVKEDPVQQQVLRTVLNAVLRLLHPVCPFITETLWPSVRGAGPAGLDGIVLTDGPVLAGAAWPDVACRVDDAEAHDRFERVQALVSAVRNLRGERRVEPRRRIRLLATPSVTELVNASEGAVETLCLLERVEPFDGSTRPADTIPLAFEGEEILLGGLVEQVDVAVERENLGQAIARLESRIAGLESRLANPGYVDKAPARLVQETRDTLEAQQKELAAARSALQSLE